MIEDLNPSMKIIVIGNGQVGKSTLTVKFVKNIFTTQYKQTLGVDFLNIKKYIKKKSTKKLIFIYGIQQVKILIMLLLGDIIGGLMPA